MGATATVPMLAPDGTSGDIPQANVQAAMAKGFKQAVSMTSPDGKQGYIPVERRQDALKAGFKMVGTPEAPQEGFWTSLGHSIGVPTSMDELKANADAQNPLKHPVKAILGPAGDVAGALYGGAKRSAGELLQASRDAFAGNRAGAAVHGITAIPFVGPGMEKATDQYAAGNTAGEMGTLVGTALQAAPAALGVADAALPARPTIPNPPSPSAIKAKVYPTSQSLAPATSAARNLSKALVVDPAGVNNFVRAATDEAGTVVDFAQKNNLPINSKVDFANAAKQTADAVQSHFDNILEPNAKKIASVPASYQGPRVGEGNNATLGAINDRINAINSELKSNYRKPLQSQTSAANASDAELLSEKSALTNVLHKQLGDASGLPPEAIADLRMQAGKLRTIADESQASANRDLTAAGKQAMGTTTSAVGTKAGIIDRGLQFVQGGPEIIGNRQINLALKKVQPQPLNLPQPTSVGVPAPAPRVPTGGPSTVIPGPDYTPDPNAGNILRDRIAARQPAPVEAPPQPIKQMQKWADAGAAKMTAQGIPAADVNRLAALPAGKQLLLKASGITPESTAMKNLVLQAQRLLATGEANYR